MSRDKGTSVAAAVPEPAASSAPLLAGHLVVYPAGVLAFRADGSEEVSRQQVPAMILPLLVKVLKGEQLSASDLPGGLMGKMAGAMMRS